MNVILQKFTRGWTRLSSTILAWTCSTLTKDENQSTANIGVPLTPLTSPSVQWRTYTYEFKNHHRKGHTTMTRAKNRKKKRSQNWHRKVRGKVSPKRLEVPCSQNGADLIISRISNGIEFVRKGELMNNNKHSRPLSFISLWDTDWLLSSWTQIHAASRVFSASINYFRELSAIWKGDRSTIGSLGF